jgi:hypothetical protein
MAACDSDWQLSILSCFHLVPEEGVESSAGSAGAQLRRAPDDGLK